MSFPILLLISLMFRELPADTDDCTNKVNTPAPCFKDGYPDYPNSKVLLQKSVSTNGFPFVKRTGYFRFPDKDIGSGYHIDYIFVENDMHPGQQGLVTLMEGGVSYNKAVFSFESKGRGLGYKFSIEIKGGKVQHKFLHN